TVKIDGSGEIVVGFGGARGKIRPSERTSADRRRCRIGCRLGQCAACRDCNSRHEREQQTIKRAVFRYLPHKALSSFQIPVTDNGKQTARIPKCRARRPFTGKGTPSMAFLGWRGKTSIREPCFSCTLPDCKNTGRSVHAADAETDDFDERILLRRRLQRRQS